MKKFAWILAAVLTLSSNGAFAQVKTTGSAAQAGTFSANKFAWGIGLGGLLVLGAVVGITAGAASSNPSNFSH